MTDCIKVGIIGCGSISHTHAEAAQYIKDMKIVACCDIDETKSLEWKKRYKCKSSYSDLDLMLQNEDLDAIILCTWPIQHLQQITVALNYGIKNILCEKSLALNSSEAIEIQRLIRENEAYLMEACKNRFHPVFMRIEELVNSGEIGEIDAISTTFSNYEPDDLVQDDEVDWRFKKECGGGVPYDWMSYLVNGANFFSKSKPKRVFASGTMSPRFDVITRLYGMIEYENGITANISSSKNASFSMEMELTGSKGIINLPVAWAIFGNVEFECRKRLEDWPYIIKDSYAIEHKDCFVLQLQNFSNVIKGIASPVIPLSESVMNVRTIEALVKSLESQKIVTIER